MKKLILFFLAIGLAFTLGTCNTPADPIPDPPKDITVTFGGTDGTGQIFTMTGDDTEYPGCEVPLSGDILDISNYSRVIVDATLYSDKEGETEASEPAGENKNLAQFKLLKVGGGENWDSADNNVCGTESNTNTKYNMAIDGPTTMSIPAGSGGVPRVLLVQANWAGNPEVVKSIKVRSVKFVVKSTGGGDNEITVDHVYEIKDGTNFLGCQIDLADWGTFADISQYASVTIDAKLYFSYTSEETNTPATAKTGTDSEGESTNNQAQFRLLKSGGDWDNSDTHCSPTKYSMAVDGPTTLNIPAGTTGVPAFLLLQANHRDFNEGERVTHIKVRTITFTARTVDMDFSLDKLFGDSVTVQGNKIIFNNASYNSEKNTGSDWDGTLGVGSAALCVFPESWEATDTESLAGKTIRINFTIEEHTCTSTATITSGVEHQLNIQAAQNTPEKDLFNGQNPYDHNGVGQKYITLDSTDETSYNSTTRTGTITIAANDLIAASKVSGSANDYKGPFILDSVRISNNGTRWEETAEKIHYRCKTYPLVINSVTITP